MFPIGASGTQKLPDSQLDRFMIRLSMGYPNHESAINILKGDSHSTIRHMEAAINRDELLSFQQKVSETHVSDGLYEYAVSLTEATRNPDLFALGLSPRGSIAFLHAAQAHAAMQGRNHVLPDDVKAVAADVLSHRIICKGHGALQSSDQAKEILAQILNQTRAPIEG
jgi:MoxR-like ATPase